MFYFSFKFTLKEHQISWRINNDFQIFFFFVFGWCINNCINKCINNCINKCINNCCHLDTATYQIWISFNNWKSLLGKKFHPKIVTDKKKIICEEIQCKIVKNFSLIENVDIDCHLNFLEIEFLAAHGIVVHGYISYSANEIYRYQ